MGPGLDAEVAKIGSDCFAWNLLSLRAQNYLPTYLLIERYIIKRSLYVVDVSPMVSILNGLVSVVLLYTNINIFYCLLESNPAKLEASHTYYSDISPFEVNLFL